MALEKTYVYKVYRAGLFVSTFKNVVSKFQYNQNIDTAGTQLTIELGNKFDDIGAVATEEKLVDESGNFIVDQNNINLLVSSANNFNNIPINLGNEIQVYMYSDDYPNGLKVFTGLISGFTASHKNDNIQIKVLNYGVQLDNYLLSSDPTATSISQILVGTEYTLAQFSKDPQNALAQSFNIASATVVGSITVYARAATAPFTSDKTGDTISPVAYTEWKLYSGTPTAPGSLVAGGNVGITGTAIQAMALAFASPQTLSGDYYLVLYNTGAGTWYYSNTVVQANNTNPYAGGTIFTAPDYSSPVWTAVAANDMAFTVNSVSGSSNLAFTNTDPSGIIQRCLDQLKAQGGKVTYSSTSIVSTNSTSSYTFKVATILDAIKSIFNFAPSGFYWYVDPATNIFYLNTQSSLPDHRLMLGKHLNELELNYTLENVRNIVVFSGGDSGAGSNIYVVGTNQASSSNYGQWLGKLSDNRVTADAQADTVISSFLGSNSEPTFRTSITIPNKAYNIESFNLGEMVGFGNFNNLIDNLLLQIVGVARHADYVTLTLGQVPPIASSAYEDLRRRLEAQETVKNPATPT